MQGPSVAPLLWPQHQEIFGITEDTQPGSKGDRLWVGMGGQGQATGQTWVASVPEITGQTPWKPKLQVQGLLLPLML